MARRLWEASEELKRNANITAFMRAVNGRHALNLTTYPELYKWSIDHIPEFWALAWDHARIISSKRYDEIVDDPYRMPGTKWFEGARMNFAENLLRRRDDHTAFVFRGEDQVTERMSYADLYATVAGLAKSLRDLGVKPGDRVVGYMPNMIETAAAMLATTAIGATWASCATDIGPVRRRGSVARGGLHSSPLSQLRPAGVQCAAPVRPPASCGVQYLPIGRRDEQRRLQPCPDALRPASLRRRPYVQVLWLAHVERATVPPGDWPGPIGVMNPESCLSGQPATRQPATRNPATLRR
jgi:hypothetical protein